MTGVFVKASRVKRNNKTYEYLTLVEAVRDGDTTGHRVLFRLGEAGALRASGQLNRNIAALRAHAERAWLPADELSAESAPDGRIAGRGAGRVATLGPRCVVRQGRCRPWRRGVGLGGARDGHQPAHPTPSPRRIARTLAPNPSVAAV